MATDECPIKLSTALISTPFLINEVALESPCFDLRNKSAKSSVNYVATFEVGILVHREDWNN